MNRNRLAQCFMAFCFLFGARVALASHAPLSTPAKWNLVWSDEFNKSGALDMSKWEFETGGGGWGNGELENYTDHSKNVRVENGNLVIEARKEKFETEDYTSGRIHSKGPGWKYGRIEVRAKMARGVGTWPAIWMLASQMTYSTQGWPDNGEIDLVEHVGRDPKNMLSCFYTKNFNWMNGNGKTVYNRLHYAQSAYHVFSLEWNADRAAISLDGEEINVFENPHTDWGDWPFDQKYYLIMNLALGGFGGDLDPSVTSAKMQVDYVRVYQQANR